jgi:hypothetical protein
MSLHWGESEGNECEHVGSYHDSSDHISSAQVARLLADHLGSSNVNHMNRPSSMNLQCEEAKHQSKQDGTGIGSFEVSTLRDIVVSKHEYFNCGPRATTRKGLHPLYQVIKLSTVGGLRLVELLP